MSVKFELEQTNTSEFISIRNEVEMFALSVGT